MRLLYLLKTDRTGPSSRHRYLQFVPALERAGWDVTVRHLFDARYFDILDMAPGNEREARRAIYSARRLAVRALQTVDFPRFDLVVIEHQCFPYLPPLLEAAMFAGRRLLRRPKIAVEFDDAIYLTRWHEAKLTWLVRNVDRVIVGNRHLGRWAADRIGLAAVREPRVTVVPTVFRASEFTPRTHYETHGPVKLGWIGLPYNFPMVAEIMPALALAAERVALELHIVSRQPPPFAGMRVVYHPWEEAREAEMVREFDIGLMPLPDDEWARGKCGAKLLQYMLCAVPAVASPVGVNADLLGDNERGLAARTADEWANAVLHLAAEKHVRAQLGRAARDFAAAEYSVETWERRLPGIYAAIVRGVRTAHDFPAI